ncbi:MAG: ornithine carbamoyltransferase [Anaerolineae bacterium]|nr:ornithine carbamoyltransferase [Anaerolineae bacterium]
MKHFITLSDWSTQDLWQIIQLAVSLKLEWQSGGNRPVLHNQALGMIFQKPSLRTRVSFEIGMQHLGGHALYLSPAEIGLGKRESIADVARVMSGYVQGIMARVFDHAHVLELAKYATVPVINGLSDARHPCQAMADILTIYERFGTTRGLKLAYIGDGNNVAQSLLLAAAHFGMHFSIATPPEYELPANALLEAAPIAEKNNITVQTVHDPNVAVEGADVIYTDTWVSMGQEEETARRLEILKPYQVNAALVKRAHKEAVVMHCLPAHRGDEITDEVADGPQSVIFPQAENRLHAQKAILVKLMGPN